MGANRAGVVIVVDAVPESLDGKIKPLFKLAGALIKSGCRACFAAMDESRASFDNFKKHNADLKLQGLGIHCFSDVFLPEGRKYESTHVKVDEAFEWPGNAHAMRRYYADGNPFLTVMLDAQGSVMAARRDGFEDSKGDLGAGQGLWEYWFWKMRAQLAMEWGMDESDVVFVLEDHGHDEALFDNRFADKPFCTIALVRAGFLRDPYCLGAGHVPMKGVAKTIGRYSGVVFYTQSQLDHACSEFGPRMNLHWAAPVQDEVGQDTSIKPKRNAFALHVAANSLAGAEVAMRAFAKARMKHADCTLDLYGSQANRKHLLDIANSLGVSNAVGSYAGRAFTERTPQGYEGVLSLCDHTGIDIRLLESLASGIYVIAFDYLYGPSEILMDPACGTVVSAGDEDALAQALCATMERGFLARRASKKACQNAVESFSSAVVGKRWLQIIASARERADFLQQGRIPAFCAVHATLATISMKENGELTRWSGLARIRFVPATQGANAKDALASYAGKLQTSLQFRLGEPSPCVERTYARGAVVGNDDENVFVQFVLDAPAYAFDAPAGTKPFRLWICCESYDESLHIDPSDILTDTPQSWIDTLAR